MKKLLFILALCVGFSINAQEDKPIEVPQIAVKIGVSETVNLDTVSISFLEVVTDSRCPRNVECMWEGEAKVKVLITNKDGNTTEEIITFKNGASVLTKLFDTQFQFLRLTPYPDADVAIADRAPYKLLMKTFKK